MGLTLTEKIIKTIGRWKDGKGGREIGYRIRSDPDTGLHGRTMRTCRLEPWKVPRVKTNGRWPSSTINMLQRTAPNNNGRQQPCTSRSVAKKPRRCYFIPARQTALPPGGKFERFGVPGPDLCWVGQSYTHRRRHRHAGHRRRRTGCGRGLAGGEYYITMPQVVQVELTGA